MDPFRFLNTRDPLEARIMTEIANRVREFQEIDIHNLASKIVEILAKSLK